MLLFVVVVDVVSAVIIIIIIFIGVSVRNVDYYLMFEDYTTANAAAVIVVVWV